MTALPIDCLLPEILESLRHRPGLVIVAPPGSGKTTRVPPALAEGNLLPREHPRVLLLQPRRVAARAAAVRIAQERGWQVGREVGYQVRHERRIGRETRLAVVTEGILTRRLLADPFLDGVGAVILDEFHERSLHTDLAAALLRELRDSVREDLRLIVMSATLDAEPIARFLDAPSVRIDVPPAPVDIEYAPRAAHDPIPAAAARAVERLLEVGPDPGDILVFLPGAEEIRRTARHLEPAAARHDLLVLPLHGSLPAEAQDRALKPADRRKVVLATNVAETSLTIEGVRTVVDSGLARQAEYGPDRGLDRLVLRRISRASATQRAGRAGRMGPGRCVRLWSERETRGLPEFDVPEIQRVDLTETALALRSWGHTRLADFGWFEPPPAARLEAADAALGALGAIDAGGRITPLGRRLLELPVHPRLGRLLLAAAEAGLLREGATLAALLAEKDFLIASAPGRGGDRRTADGDSDLLVRLDLLEDAERRRFAPGLRDQGVDPHAARRIVAARDELIRIGRRLVRDRTATNLAEADQLLWLVLLAYPDRVVRRRAPGSLSGVMVGGRGVRLDPASCVREAELFVALDPREDRRGGRLELQARIASAVRPEWLDAVAPGSLRREQVARFDPGRGRVVGVTRWRYRDLVLREDPGAAVDPIEGARVLAEALVDRAEARIRDDPAAASWLDRVAFLRGAMPDLDLPEFDAARLASVIEAACAGCLGEEEVRRSGFLGPLRSQLATAQARAVDEHAPEALAVPSGSRIRLRYEPGRPPVLAARLQELFGWAETPRVAAGRVPVLLEILGPNYRPVQVTTDLRSFWNTTYAQVRKDLRARYPRHAWPDDPRTATAVARGGRRRD